MRLGGALGTFNFLDYAHLCSEFTVIWQTVSESQQAMVDEVIHRTYQNKIVI